MKRSLLGLVLASSLALFSTSAFSVGGEHGNGDSGMGEGGGMGGGGGGMLVAPSSLILDSNDTPSPSPRSESAPSTSGLDTFSDRDELMDRATQPESGTASAGAINGQRGTGAAFGEGYTGQLTHHGDDVNPSIEQHMGGHD